LIGLSKDHPLPAPDTLELCDQLLRRCAAAHNTSFSMIQAEKVEIFDMMLTLTAYHHPENIALPQGLIIYYPYLLFWTQISCVQLHLIRFILIFKDELYD